MAQFRALDGIEYCTSKAGPLGTLVAPPYDVIDGPARARLAATSPHNIVNLILPRPAGGLDRYQAARRLVESWRRDGVLVDGGRAFYVIEQRFSFSSGPATRTAILGRLRVGPWRESGVFPHEVTLSRTKADRMNLYRATKLQPGPIFTLFEEAAGDFGQLLGEVKKAPPDAEFDGPEGAHDLVWKVTEEGLLDALERTLSGGSFFVADGHHRYETALAYRDELAGGGQLPRDHPANFVLTAAVGSSDEGLRVLPTHRLISVEHPQAVSAGLEALGREYHIDTSGPADEAPLADCGPGAMALYAKGMLHKLQMKPAARSEFEKSEGKLLSGLNVHEARLKVLSCFFRDVDSAVEEENIRYTHEVSEAVVRVDSGEFDAALLLAPIPVEKVAKVARAGEIMPPKSTYFFPKLPTGVVLNPLC